MTDTPARSGLLDGTAEDAAVQPAARAEGVSVNEAHPTLPNGTAGGAKVQPLARADGGLAVETPAFLPSGTAAETAVLRLLEEQAVVSRRLVEGQTVRVSTTTRLHEQIVDEVLAHETVEVERVPVGRVVEAAPAIRQDGDTTIIPVMEEVLVLERRLVLKEEVRIRRVRTTEQHRQTVQLRQQVASVTRAEATSTVAGAVHIEPPTSQKRD